VRVELGFLENEKCLTPLITYHPFASGFVSKAIRKFQNKQPKMSAVPYPGARKSVKCPTKTGGRDERA